MMAIMMIIINNYNKLNFKDPSVITIPKVKG